MKTSNRFLLAGMFVVASVATSLVMAADKDKKPEDKPVPAKEQMYMAACPDPCAFTVKSHDKKEIVAVIKEHAKTHHNMTMSDKDADAMVTPAVAASAKK